MVQQFYPPKLKAAEEVQQFSPKCGLGGTFCVISFLSVSLKWLDRHIFSKWDSKCWAAWAFSMEGLRSMGAPQILQNTLSGSFHHNAVRGIRTHHFWWSSGGKEDLKICEVRTSCCGQSCSLFLPQRFAVSEKLPTTPRAETWTSLGSLGSLSAMFGPWTLGLPLDAPPAYSANSKAGGGRHAQQLMGYTQL